MRCHDARDVIQSMLDRDKPRGAHEALRHLRECGECARWNASMDAMLRTIIVSETSVPDMDVASQVMARLPDRHPASTATAQTDVSGWRKRPIIALVGSWLLGAVILAAAFALCTHWKGAADIVAGIVTVSRSAAEAIWPLAMHAAAPARALTSTCSAFIIGCVTELVKLRHALAIAFMLDCVLLAGGYIGWRYRQSLSGRISLLA